MTAPAGPERRSLRRCLIGGLAAALLAGCSQPPPVEGWMAPAWDDPPGVQLATGTDTDPLADAGLVERRVRNDAAGFQARYVEIQGATEFNKRVDAIVREPLAGVPIEPEAFPPGSGLADRGCVPGSVAWAARRVLTDPATGPVNGSGTAITCEITATFGSTIGITMRTVTGTDGVVGSDSRVTLYTDLQKGTVIDAADLWTPQAAAELWTRTVEQLRRSAGGLSTVPIGPPPAEQAALAAQALVEVRERDDGTAVLTLPPGLASPELAGLGIESTTEPVGVEIDADLLATWRTETGARLDTQRGVPFAGLPAWNAGPVPDCSLFTCVAVTYDDGPGEHTTRLLETLRTQQAGATFFMQCRFVGNRQEVVRAVAAAGHEIGSHTFTHPDLTTLSASAAADEVNDCADLLSTTSGKPVNIYRPPYGAVNAKMLETVELPAIMWSVDTNDWQRPGADALFQRSVPVAERGDIILFHDIHPGSVEAAGQIIEGLKDRGFTPVTVTQLFGGEVPPGTVRRR